MKLSPDGAAGSPLPPSAEQGPAAPSFPGAPGRRRPEDPRMPEQPPVADAETARRAGGLVAGPLPGTAPGGHGQSARHGRPAPAGSDRAVDDTRPVSRDWMTTD